MEFLLLLAPTWSFEAISFLVAGDIELNPGNI